MESKSIQQKKKITKDKKRRRNNTKGDKEGKKRRREDKGFVERAQFSRIINKISTFSGHDSSMSRAKSKHIH